MSECKKCGNEMQMTPICSHCGDIPIAKSYFDELDELKSKLKNNSKMVADGFANQVVIYAKGWYGHGKNIIDDLKHIFGKYNGGIPIEHVSDRDMWQILCMTFEEFVPLFDRQEALPDILGKRWGKEILQRKPEEIMIGKISIIKGELFNIDEKMNFSLDNKCHHFCNIHRQYIKNCGCKCNCEICSAS